MNTHLKERVDIIVFIPSMVVTFVMCIANTIHDSVTIQFDRITPLLEIQPAQTQQIVSFHTHTHTQTSIVSSSL